MRDSLKDHIRILQFAAYKARLENLKPLQKIPGELEKVLSSQEANADLPTEIPAHALVRVSETRSIISPKWLAKQRPPQALIDGGGEIYDEKDVYSPEKRNPDKMQCWQKDGNWYWNAKARTWLATQWYARQGAKIDTMIDLKNMVSKEQGDNNAETMDTLQIAPVGWFSAVSGEVGEMGLGVVPSSSRNDDGFMQVLWFSPDGSAPEDGWIWYGGGIVPFISVNTPK